MLEQEVKELRESVREAVEASGLYKMLGANACEVAVTIRSGHIGDQATMEVVATMKRLPSVPRAKIPGK